jgi:hypothetical protein
LDPAGTCAGGQHRDDRLHQELVGEGFAVRAVISKPTT